ncbi:WD40 repeat-like protein [Polyporus arcularius HHB13444]|uniref:WD40 repeat-like protein n=1 Tax=Polyporus arcularius HHB13444 TaxID=1314778 RepID=A0A5C3PKM5_9APHY|nr:WD40 repeat-like protein [Polyporus arcularius HHB13444]
MHSSSVDTLLRTSSSPPSYPRSRDWKENHLSAAYARGGLDRVKVLGNGAIGHTGCVNALSWAKGGEMLISSGDDTTIRLWRMDKNSEEDYPFVCDAIIDTGHRANVFNAQMLPYSSRIATVAGDRQVRVFDHERAAGFPRHTGEMEYSTRAAVIRVLRCHSGRTKRIVTEDSPDLFLTVAEDGTVRQHDLRVPHTCSSESCPAPLVQVNHELSTLSLSPLTPYHFVVAGSSPYGYLFDRRHAGRQFREEWGQPPDEGEVTTCVRRFGRRTRGQHERQGREHVTGSRMASSNGHEVLLSYSSDAIYLYSTRDNPEPTSMGSRESSLIPPNNKRQKLSEDVDDGNDTLASDTEMSQDRAERDALMEEDIERMLSEESPSSRPRRELRPLLSDDMDEDDPDVREEDEEDEDEDEDEDNSHGDERYAKVPTIMPRSRFEGICNVETVKDVNFLGPRDEFVVSGSDDGNWFMWEKDTGRLHDILEGDGTVVNVIEGHPYLPLVAVSGIDHTVKLFAPTPGPSRFSRLDKADAIMNRNAEAARPRRSEVANLYLYYRLAQSMAQEGDGQLECAHQ